MIQIGTRQIGSGYPAYIIAEAGVNHNGKLELALELVRAAAATGADCIKFQTFKAEQVARLEAPKAPYQLEVTDRQESQFEMLKKLELNPADYTAIIKECTKQEIEFMSTPYHRDDVDFLQELDVPAFKVASATLVEDSFLAYVASRNKPVIVSTGMATLDEVNHAVQVVRTSGNNDLVLLQCTTDYPADISEVNLRAMRTMEEQTGCLVGFSDHVTSNYAAFAAVALGACVIEKHFTLDRSLAGPDHRASLDPSGFNDLVSGIRQTEKALGDSRKIPTSSELNNISGMRRSIVAVHSLQAGHVVTESDVCFKRPGTGLAPSRLADVIGRKLKNNVDEDCPLSDGDIEW